jgi:hypothetical protein
MTVNPDNLKSIRQRRYLARDFDSMRATLLDYARLYYPDRLKDFSEASLGGLFLDFASGVADNLSFYLDHLYSELDPATAVESVNVERLLRKAGVTIVGAAPAIVPQTVFIQVPAERVQGVIGPMLSAFPIVNAGTIFLSDGGAEFILLEDIDFNKKTSVGTYAAEIRVGQKAPDGTPTTFTLAAPGLCVSGKETMETITIGSSFVPFRRVTLGSSDVSEIVAVTDGLGNVYYQVSALTHDVVYRNVLNTNKDLASVRDVIRVIPAPYRFTTETDIAGRRTTLVFGSGDANTLDDDVIPDPSDFAIAFPYSKTFSRLPIDPNQLLQTKTLGVAATNTTLSVTYRYGGGLNHNAPVNNIRSIKTLKMFFPSNPSPTIAASVRSSAETTNRIQASGGDDAPSQDDLKALIPSVANAQERIVTRPDLLARVYTLPSNFGRVFRAAVRSNPNNPLATQLFIASRDADSRLITSPDTLKNNLRTYLNPYRMISDAIDILDARVVNIGFSFDVIIDPTLNRNVVMQNVLAKLQTFFNIKNFHIDQPIVVSDIVGTIFSTLGIVSVNNTMFTNIVGTVDNRVYSDQVYDVASNVRTGMLFPPPGGIFEVRFTEFDITGKAAT